LGLGVVHKEIHGAIAIGEKEDLLANPHGKDILCFMVGYIDGFMGGEVMNPHIVGHAALIIFPGTELPKHTVVGKLVPIGRIGAKTSLGQRNLREESSLRRGFVEIASETKTVHSRTEYHLSPVGGPCHHNVIGAHSVGNIVAIERGSIGNPLGFATRQGEGINLGIAVVLSGKCQCLSIRCKPGKHLKTHMISELLRNTPRNGNLVKVAGIGKYHRLTIGSREAEQTGLFGRLQRKAEEEGQKHCKCLHKESVCRLRLARRSGQIVWLNQR